MRPGRHGRVEIARASADERAVARALIARALTALFLGRSEGVIEGVAEGAAIAERYADDTALAFTFAGVAQWQAESGAWAEATVSLGRAEEAAQRSGNPEVIAFAALGRGRVDGYAGNLDEARQAFARAIEAYEAIEDDALALVVRSDLAHVLRHNGRTAEAIAAYRGTLPDGSTRATGVRSPTRWSRSRCWPRPRDPRMRPGSWRQPGRSATSRTHRCWRSSRRRSTPSLDALRTSLGEPALQTAEREGHQLDRDAVIREALDLLDELERELSPVDPPG